MIADGYPPSPPHLFTSEPGGARPMMSMYSPSMGTSAYRVVGTSPTAEGGGVSRTLVL